MMMMDDYDDGVVPYSLKRQYNICHQLAYTSYYSEGSDMGRHN